MIKRMAVNKRTFFTGLFLLAVGCVLYLALKKNPTDSEEKILRMRVDIARMLEAGGTVIERTENAKYGSAHVLLVMSDVGWSEMLTDRYEAVLLANGWTKRKDLSGYCLNGMRLAIKRHDGMRDGASVNFIGATYNAQTIRDCS